MPATGVGPVVQGDHHQQIERLVASSLLHGSESLCRLLQYLAHHAETNPGTPIKEHQIATAVFARGESFDPRVDAIVRVQSSRLRTKLVEYYAIAGARDPVVVELPKGSYSLVFRDRPEEAAVVEPLPSPPMVSPRRDWRPSLTLLFSVLTLVAVAGLWWMRQPSSPAPASASPVVALRTLWAGFVDPADPPPLVVYSNAEFVGRPETGMRYFDPQRDEPKQILDHYTGVGEVEAAHELGGLFHRFGRPLRIKRARLLSLDDVKGHNLVFVGSPSENLPLRELPMAQDFVFALSGVAGRERDLAILNTRPQPGEPARFLASSQPPIEEDYAVVRLQAGLGAGRQILSLAGITTLGTQAAVEFVCRESQVEPLLRRLGGSKVPNFEAVLRVKIARGVPVLSEVIALHRK